MCQCIHCHSVSSESPGGGRRDSQDRGDEQERSLVSCRYVAKNELLEDPRYTVISSELDPCVSSFLYSPFFSTYEQLVDCLVDLVKQEEL